MAANTRLASATQILCVMAYLGEDTTSQVIARSLRTNPVVVRRLLKRLEQAGLVALRRGKEGGVSLARSPDEITLDQVYAAVEEDAGVFALRPGSNPHCPVDRTVPRLLDPLFAAAREAVAAVLATTTVGTLVQSVP
ncbi:MAG: Rrf2 family transcriptional regulator [Acetobacteraceae bacterium]|nr:Rrf2 family transcriptional regulator [Acetobacteraceae bacterium]